MNILDWLTLLSCLALAADILLQIKRVYRTKSSNDLSLLGMTIRYIAIIVILVKFISLNDLPLMIGQGVITIIFTAYLFLAIVYFRHRRNT
jgi:uncharacterized protein with PQ loop repeat